MSNKQKRGKVVIAKDLKREPVFLVKGQGDSIRRGTKQEMLGIKRGQEGIHKMPNGITKKASKINYK